jgi:hypothetical protein
MEGATYYRAWKERPRRYRQRPTRGYGHANHDRREQTTLVRQREFPRTCSPDGKRQVLSAAGPRQFVTRRMHPTEDAPRRPATGAQPASAAGRSRIPLQLHPFPVGNNYSGAALQRGAASACSCCSGRSCSCSSSSARGSSIMPQPLHFHALPHSLDLFPFPLSL